ncbi:hypothetical protein M5689_023362 [Euphorbia peplus]|nr:hypothetical protein M5689_023362 [Euphorbia peplus]
MANNNRLLRHQIANMRQSFFDEGILDRYFVQLEQLEGPDDPDFVEEIFTIFFHDTTIMIGEIEQQLDMDPPNVKRVERLLHHIKINASNLGTIKIKQKVVSMRICLKARNILGAWQEFRLIRDEYETVKMRLQAYFQLIAQAGGAAALLPPGSP